MISAVFLPNVERTLGCVGSDEVEIVDHKLQHGGLERVVQVGAPVAPSCERQDLKSRSIILRARPSCKIESSIWIDARFAEHRAA